MKVDKKHNQEILMRTYLVKRENLTINSNSNNRMKMKIYQNMEHV